MPARSPATAATLAQLRAHIARVAPPRASGARLPAGVHALDQRVGGWPRPGMAEVCGLPGTGRLAAFLGIQIAERQRLVREAERVAKERDRERASLERERQANDKERDKREEALRQQLEALRAIERGIIDREERLRRKPGAKP